MKSIFRRHNAPVVALLLAATCWSFFADAMHHHSLRMIQSPELAAQPLSGSAYCPVDRLLTVVDGGDTPATPAIQPPTDAQILISALADQAYTARPLTDHLSRAPPVSL